MLQSRVFLLLLATSTIFTATMIVSSSMGRISLLSFLPTVCTRPEPPNTTEHSEIDYSDVDSFSNELEHQIIQLLGNEKDSVHSMDDIYPGKALHQSEKRSPYLRYTTFRATLIGRMWTKLNDLEVLAGQVQAHGADAVDAEEACRLAARDFLQCKSVGSVLAEDASVVEELGG